MYEPDVTVLLMYGSHDMRHTGFHKLAVVNETPGFGASHQDLKSEYLARASRRYRKLRV